LLAGAGDDPALVHLLTNNAAEMYRPLEERLPALRDKYFPQGQNSLYTPQQGHVLGFPPRVFEREPMAEGGAVDDGIVRMQKWGSVKKGILSTIDRLAEGKPKQFRLPDDTVYPAYPIKEVDDVAASFARRHGNPETIESFPKFDEDRAKRIANAYESMRHDPASPEVRRAYEALIDETMDQYNALKPLGVDYQFLKPGEGNPYKAAPSEGYLDLLQNNRMKVFPTEGGFGTNVEAQPNNPLLRKVGRVGDLEDATANDAFRVVHDMLGHYGPGNPFFRRQGEDRAWLLHGLGYSDDALPAATSELRGQNSWVNSGPHSIFNRTANQDDTIYADQKTGLLPSWAWEDRIRNATKKAEGGVVRMNKLGAVKKGIEAVRRGALSTFKDAPTKHIDDWMWNPMSEVAKNMPTEVSASADAYGDFMKKMSSIAGSEGLSSEDVMKAYLTTRASIQRQAIGRHNIDPSFKLSSPEEMIRPEGAYADWLRSSAGEKYLKYAGEGEAHPDAIQNAINVMRPFGLHNKLASDMRAAPSIIPGREGRLSELIARSAKGEGSPTKWMDATRDLPGINSAKRGFMGSMLGYGDLPTLDARQLALHVPDGDAQFGKFGRRNHGAGGDEAVERLAARLRALDLDLAPDKSPFYPHLAHHTVWDTVGGTDTTHDDIMNMMLHRAEGGPVNMRFGGPTPDFGDDGYRSDVEDPENIQRVSGKLKALKGALSAGREMISPVEEAAKASGRSVDDVLKEITRHGKDTVGKISNVPPRVPYEDVTVTRTPTYPVLDVPTVTPSQLEGSNVILKPADRTGLGYDIHGIGDVEFKRPVHKQGGIFFGQGPAGESGEVWASMPSVIAGYQNAATKAASEGMKSHYMPWAMAHTAGDSSKMSMDILKEMFDQAGIGPTSSARISKALKSGFNRGTLADLGDDSFWEKLDALSLADKFKAVGALDKAGIIAEGAPDMSHIRLALTDPRLLTAKYGDTGFSISEALPGATPIPRDRAKYPHAGYDTSLAGTPTGGFSRSIPMQVLAPEIWDSAFPPGGRPNLWNLTRGVRQFKMTPEVVDRAENWIEQADRLGKPKYAEGGSMDNRDAREAAAARATMGDMAEYRRLTREQPRGGSRTTEPGMLSRFARGEWDRFSGPAKYNPALYAQDAVGRATSGMNVSHETPSLDLMRRNTQSDSDMLNDIVPLISPDMRFRDEYGPLAAPLDVMSIISAPVMAGGRGLGKIAQEAIKHARPALDDSLMQLMKMAFPPVGAAAGTDVSRPRFARGGMFDNLDDFGIPGDGAPDRSHLPPMGFDGPESLGNESFDMMQPLEMMNMPDMGIDVIPGDNDPFGNRPYDPSEDAMRRKAAEPPKPIYQKLESPKSGGGGGGIGDILGMAMKFAPMLLSHGGPVRLPDMSFNLEGGFGSDAGDDSTSRAAAADAAHVKEQGFDNMANVMPEGSYNYGLAHGGPVRYAQGGQEHAPDFGDNFKGIPGIENLADILGGIFGGEDVNLRNITGEAGEALGTFLGMWAGVPGVGGSLGRGAGNIFSDLVEPGTGDVGRDAISAGMGAIKGYGSGFIPAGGFARGGSVDDEMLNYGVMNLARGGALRRYC
jgi:hypothetical protein